jgi:hypothetical protein
VSLSTVGTTMLEAAFHCEADLDLSESRFMVIERDRLEPDEEDRLVRMAIRTTVEDLREAVASRERAISANVGDR